MPSLHTFACSASARRAIWKALEAYRAVRFRPVIGGSRAYFTEKEARRADVLAAVADARAEQGETFNRRAA